MNMNATLTGFNQPTLEGIERRRSELLATTSFVLIGIALLAVLLSFSSEAVSWMQDLGGSVNVVRGSLVLLAVAFSAYVVQQQRHLRRLTTDLLNERVLSSALENRLRELGSLTDIGTAALSSVPLEDVLGTVLTSATELLGAEEGSVMLLEDDALVVTVAHGHPRAFIGERIPLDVGVGGHVVRAGRPVVLPGMAPRELKLTRTSRVRSSVCVPLEVDGEPLGILNLNRVESDAPFTEHDLRAAQRLAAHAGLAVRNARLFAGQRERDEEARGAVHDLESSLAMIFGTVDLLDGTTAMGRGEREALGNIGRRAQGLLVAVEGLLVEENPPAAPAADPHGSADRSLRILVADDDPSMLRLLRIGLVREGHDVLLASDGETALRRMRDDAPDLVLLEEALPVLDGMVVLERAGTIPSPPAVVMLTSRSEPSVEEELRRRGAVACLRKPFTLDDVTTMISRLVGDYIRDATG